MVSEALILIDNVTYLILTFSNKISPHHCTSPIAMHSKSGMERRSCFIWIPVSHSVLMIFHNVMNVLHYNYISLWYNDSSLCNDDTSLCYVHYVSMTLHYIYIIIKQHSIIWYLIQSVAERFTLELLLPFLTTSIPMIPGIEIIKYHHDLNTRSFWKTIIFPEWNEFGIYSNLHKTWIEIQSVICSCSILAYLYFIFTFSSLFNYWWVLRLPCDGINERWRDRQNVRVYQYEKIS